MAAQRRGLRDGGAPVPVSLWSQPWGEEVSELRALPPAAGPL